jgi:hypothetical protein
MTAAEPQPAEGNPKHPWFKFSPRKLGLLLLLFGVSVVLLAVWRIGLPLSWTADYDGARCNHIRRAIDADPEASCWKVPR